MRKLFVLILLSLIAGVFLAVQLARDPGYILIAYGNYTFETSLFALLVVMLLVLAVLKLVFSLLSWLNPMRWGTKRGKGA
ncbi:MAG: heme biosynthesis HemY N-terminal domain-containing protein [Pseudohongiella sp.]|uniref:heme biosynthesis HemY N-terminal domain-containing protein n=1 Tax=Pseudohongiella sp. TaxID=1979412 RepID=UPI0034A029C2